MWNVDSVVLTVDQYFPDNDDIFLILSWNNEIFVKLMQMMMQSKVAAVTAEWLIITSGPPTGISAQVLAQDDDSE